MLRKGLQHLVVAAVLLAGTERAAAQDAPSLGTVLAAFLPDSGSAAGNLPWSAASRVPARWASAAPAASAPYLQQEGLALHRAGTLRVSVPPAASLEAEVELAGAAAGVQRASVSFDVNEVLVRDVEQALRAEGFVLTPLRCDRATEGESYGNVVYTLKAPGKRAMPLWESWNCAHDGCRASLAILYRPADVTKVECAGA